MSAVRDSGVDDPEGFTATAVAVFCRFPEHIVARVTDPGSGIQTRQRWLPTPSELRSACEGELDEEAAAERRRQLAEHRVLVDTPDGLKPLPERRPATAEERARATAAWELERDQRLGVHGPDVVAGAERRLEELATEVRKPLTLGPELRAKLVSMGARFPSE